MILRGRMQQGAVIRIRTTDDVGLLCTLSAFICTYWPRAYVSHLPYVVNDIWLLPHAYVKNIESLVSCRVVSFIIDTSCACVVIRIAWEAYSGSEKATKYYISL